MLPRHGTAPLAGRLLRDRTAEKVTRGVHSRDHLRDVLAGGLR